MIELRNVTVQAGKFQLRNLSIEVDAGQYAVLMGRTGIGKTTLIESICGLRKVVCGQVWIHGTDVTHYSPSDREIGYVPQDLALFPTLNVREHLAFALRLRRVSRERIVARVKELAETLGITHLLDRHVQGLSGGESQRVALGRALSFEPAILLLDEPLSALDDATRRETYALLKKVQKASQVTTLHITHNQEDVDVLADCCFRMEANGMLVTVS